MQQQEDHFAAHPLNSFPSSLSVSNYFPQINPLVVSHVESHILDSFCSVYANLSGLPFYYYGLQHLKSTEDSRCELTTVDSQDDHLQAVLSSFLNLRVWLVHSRWKFSYTIMWIMVIRLFLGNVFLNLWVHESLKSQEGLIKQCLWKTYSDYDLQKALKWYSRGLSLD